MSFYPATIVSFLSLLLLSSPCRAGESILITAFEPFGGRTVNNSQIVADKIAQAQAQIGPDVSVKVCVVPVVYDQGAAKAEQCYRQMKKKPDLVLSIGETGDCHVSLETRPVNLDSTPSVPDNSGQVRSGSKIDLKGPDAIGFDFPVYEMYCALTPAERQQVAVSNSLGNYVCNNTAYHLSEFFQKQNQRSYDDLFQVIRNVFRKKKHIRYAFIHVPVMSCDGNADPTAQDAAMITKMLNVVHSTKHPPDAKAFDASGCGNQPGLPIDLAEVKDVEKMLFAEGAPECEQEFVKTLESRYESPF